MIQKLGSSNVLFDFKTNKITFLDNRFYLHENGNYYPSVTTIGDAYPKGPEYHAWLKKVGEDADSIRDEAGNRGSIVHQLTERYDAGEEINMMDNEGNISFKLLEWAMFERYVDFRSNHPLKVIHSETNFVSAALGYAGTLDRVVEMNGKTILLDIKTSNAIYPFYWLQLAAYEKLITESYGYNPIEEVGILWLNAKTKTRGKAGDIQGMGWQLITKDNTDKEWDLFQATHRLWLAENGNMKPRQLSYQLTHQLK